MKKLWSKLIRYIASFWETPEEIVPDPEANGRWRMMYGIHSGTIWSEEIVSQYYASEQEARAAYERAKRYYDSQGIIMYFAWLYDPDGRKKYLQQILDRPSERRWH